MFHSRIIPIAGLSLMSSLLYCTAAYADLTPEVVSVQKQWAQINYIVTQDEQEPQYQVLLAECERLTEPEQVTVETIIWCGIVKSTYAGFTGGLGALKYAKMARGDFERAMDIDESALSGAAYTSLGALYSKVPGWPLSFGDNKKAKKMLLKGVEMNPGGIDSNYFYAEFLFEQGDGDEALQYLRKAEQAPARPGRETADTGRRVEISVLQGKIKS